MFVGVAHTLCNIGYVFYTRFIEHPVERGGEKLSKKTHRYPVMSHGLVCAEVAWDCVVRPCTPWHVAQNDCKLYNEVYVSSISNMKPCALHSSQEHNTNIVPLLVPHQDIFVRVLKTIYMSNRKYYLGLIKDEREAKNAIGLHPISMLPEGFLTGRESVKASQGDVVLPIKGELGVVPANNAALLVPFALPAIIYNSQRGRHAPMTFNSRPTWVNIAASILQQ